MTLLRQNLVALAALLLCVLFAPIRTAAMIPHSAPIAFSLSGTHQSSPAAVLTLSEAAVSGMCRNDPVNNFDPLGLEPVLCYDPSTGKAGYFDTYDIFYLGWESAVNDGQTVDRGLAMTWQIPLGEMPLDALQGESFRMRAGPGTANALNALGMIAPVGVVAGSSMIPGVGEGQDFLVLFAKNSTVLDRILSGGSLALSVVTLGFSPNYGAPARAGREVIANTVRLADDVVAPAPLSRFLDVASSGGGWRNVGFLRGHYLRWKHRDLLIGLANVGDQVVAPPGTLTGRTIAQLTELEGVEFAVLRLKTGERVVRRGTAASVPVDIAELIKKRGIILHSHPSGILKLSGPGFVKTGDKWVYKPGDVGILQEIEQRWTLIVGPAGDVSPRLYTP